MTNPATKLLICVTDPVTAWGLMRGQLKFLASAGFNVVLVSSPGSLLDATSEREGVRVEAVGMKREISPTADVRGLLHLVKTYRVERPCISLVSTPKAGLIAGLAAWLTRVPIRIYMLRGLRLETATGPQRWLLWVMEWAALHLGHDVLVVSPSLLVRARQLHLLGPRRGTVLGRGASNGIDLARFAPTAERLAAGLSMRTKLGIPHNAFVFGFVGRLTVDKGIRELAEAFANVLREDPDAWLVIVGQEELGGLPAITRTALNSTHHVRFTGWLDDPALAYHVMDCVVLPTYREGFPNVPLEAAAAAKPVITTTATGAIDSVVAGETGLLVEPRDAVSLCRAMLSLSTDRPTSIHLGAAGQRFVGASFATHTVWWQLDAFLNTRVKARCNEHVDGVSPARADATVTGPAK